MHSYRAHFQARVLLPKSSASAARWSQRRGFLDGGCAAGRRVRLDGPSGRSLALGICLWRASHADIRGYGPGRPLEARVISARSRPPGLTDRLRVKQGRVDGQTVPGRRIPGHWPYPGPEELAETEPVGPDAWTFLSFNYHPASALAA